MNAYVSKPVRRLELMSALESLLVPKNPEGDAQTGSGSAGVGPAGSVSATLSEALSSSAVSDVVAMAATTALSSNPTTI